MAGCIGWEGICNDDDDSFFLTYGDAVADIDVADLYQHHLRGQKLVTLTAVHPAGRFGELSLDDDGMVRRFHEKPQTSAGYINGGFMVFKKEALEQLIGPEDQALEDAPLRNATLDNELQAYCHDGFWQCMDTPREHQLLNRIWNSGRAPWKMWAPANV